MFLKTFTLKKELPVSISTLSFSKFNNFTFVVLAALERYQFRIKAELNVMQIIIIKLRLVIKATRPYQNQRMTKIFSVRAFGARTHKKLSACVPPPSPPELKLQVDKRGKIISKNSLAAPAPC